MFLSQVIQSKQGFLWVSEMGRTYTSPAACSSPLSSMSRREILAEIGKQQEDENTEFRLLRCFLNHNDISAPLAQKITHFLQFQSLGDGSLAHRVGVVLPGVT